MSAKTATVLLAARSLDSLYELKTRLGSAGVRVATAGSTTEALDRLREEFPDLVVLDKDLEPVSTAALILTMRASTPPPDVILLTAEKFQDEEIIRKSLGLLYYGVRPADPGDLFDRIRDALQARNLPFSAPAPEPPVVLCVDDDSLQLSALYRVLTKHGYRVVACENAIRAMTLMTDQPPDIAVVDIMMPGIGGMEFIDRMQRRSGGRIPVVLLTALSSDSSRRAARDRGVAYYLTKPCPDREVLAAIQSGLAAAER